jgi:carbamoyltransferase
MHVLGIWDGHDSGAALVRDNEIIYAANEERFTKRKLEIDFPRHSISAALKHAGIKAHEVEHVAFTTTEFTKTLERIVPGMKENYYSFRRRKIPKPAFEHARHKLKYSITTVGPLPLCGAVSSSIIRSRLDKMGFKNYRLHVVDHHTAHAATAAFTSGQKRSLVLTLDGLGDGLSGSASVLSNGKLERVMAIGARDSIGIFYEQLTNILGMRELEDEGKIMAMADYSYPFTFDKNRFKDFFDLTGTRLRARYSPSKQYDMISKISWQMPREQTAYMAQQLVEGLMIKLSSNLIDRYNVGDLAVAGGIFSNVKANMLIRELDNVKSMHIFPHMGDGGIALGAALQTAHKLTGATDFHFSAYLGNDYSSEAIETVLKADRSLKYSVEGREEQCRHAAELMAEGNYLFWFQNRMEFGPRALGNRSILAPSDSDEVKEKLNLFVKQREWFQPFAPSMLEEDAHKLIEYDGKGFNRFMTSAYRLKPEHKAVEKSVSHVDGTVRAQMVGDENAVYRDLLKAVRKHRGYGIVLNTSFNIHGQPIVMSPEDAIDTMKRTKTKYMFMDGILVTNRAV